MKKTIFLVLALILTVGFQALAQSTSSDACAQYCDYICRHMRSDLKPVELRLTKKNAGDFYVYGLALRIKNIGEMPIGQLNGSRQLKIAVSGMGQKTATIYGQIASGASKWVGLGTVSPQRVKHCSKLKLQVDSDRTYGQFGCVVYGNDKAVLTVYEAGKGKMCRIPVGGIKLPR